MIAAQRVISAKRAAAGVVFTAGPPNAPRVYQEAGELVTGYGTRPVRSSSPTPPPIATRAPRAEGRTVLKTEPAGKAAEEVRAIDT